jgi:integrase
MKSNFSEPKLFTGGIDISQWNKLSKQQQNDALLKEWYVYYSFRNPNSGKLERQSNIKTGVNALKTKNLRLEKLKLIQESLLFLLKKGFNPYQDNSQLEKELYSKKEENTIITTEPKPIIIEEIKEVVVENEMSIRESFEFGLNIKINVLGKTSYSGFQGRIKRFLEWLDKNGSSKNDISSLDKKTVNNYLNFVLENTSASNRNNTRTDLSSLIQVLVDNEIMNDNFIKSINVLKSSPERNKTYSTKQENDLLKYLAEKNAILLLFIQFISYNFLRPVEVCRLKIGDLDVNGKKLFVRAKNKAVKVKIIPQKVIDLLPDLSLKNPDHYLFTPNELGGEWKAEENNRRNHFSKEFKAVKDHFGLGIEYGLYSFRHTSITNLYRELVKDKTPHETKSILMGITGHQTMEVLEKYLRDIDAELPKDYSHFLN